MSTSVSSCPSESNRAFAWCEEAELAAQEPGGASSEFGTVCVCAAVWIPHDISPFLSLELSSCTSRLPLGGFSCDAGFKKKRKKDDHEFDGEVSKR